MKKEFDCVDMKHDIQRKIYEDTKDMTHEEEMAFFNQACKDKLNQKVFENKSSKN